MNNFKRWWQRSVDSAGEDWSTLCRFLCYILSIWYGLLAVLAPVSDWVSLGSHKFYLLWQRLLSAAAAAHRTVSTSSDQLSHNRSKEQVLTCSRSWAKVVLAVIGIILAIKALIVVIWLSLVSVCGIVSFFQRRRPKPQTA